MGDGIVITLNAETAVAAANLTNFFEKVSQGMKDLQSKTKSIPPIIPKEIVPKEAESKVNAFFGKITQHLNSLSGAGAFLSGLGTQIAGALTVTAIVAGLQKAVDSMDELGRASQKTGLSIEALKSLKTLGRHEELPFDELVMGLEMFNNKIFEAVRIGGEAARPFRDLNIQLFDTNGNVRDGQKLLGELMDKFKAMPDGIQKTGLAMEMFSRAGRQMIPFLNQGSGGLSSAKGGIGKEDVEAAHQFNLTLSDIGASFKKLFMEIAAEILPVMQQFASWLKKATEAGNEHARVVRFVAFAFRALATAAVMAFTNLDGLMTFLAGTALAAIKQFQNAWQGMVDGFSMFKVILQGIITIIDDLLSGNFGKMKEDIATLGDNVEYAARLIKESFVNAWNIAGKSGKLVINELIGSYKKLGETVARIWYGGKTSSADTSAKGVGGGSSGLATGPITSDTAKKLQQEIFAEYEQATKSQLEILIIDRNAKMRQAELEISDDKKRSVALLEIEETYQAKKRALQESRADEDRQLAVQDLQARIAAAEQDPDLTTAERKEKLLDLFLEEKKLLQEILGIEQQRANDPARNEDQQEQAKKSAEAIKKQMAQVNGQFDKAGQSPFSKVILQLRQQNDLQQEVAENFGRVFNGAISSISGGITGLIEGTKNWGQALREIGASILNSIIGAIVEMGVRWVMTQIMMAAFGRSMAAASTAALVPIAAAQSAIWSAPATLSTIASYGEAAAQAPGMIAIAEGATAALSFATGGIIPPGERFIRVNENGQEAVLNAGALRFLGPSFVHAANSLGSRMVGNLPRPITGGGGLSQVSAGPGAASIGGGSGAPIVQGHKVTVIVPRDNRDIYDAMRSAEGEKIHVDISRRRRQDIGIGT